MLKTSFICLLTLLMSSGSYGQSAPAKSVYDPVALFNPSFYPDNGNEYRSGNGEPGPQYWQNRADYSIRVRLDEDSNRVSGSLVLTYTNNSPHSLPFIWLQLDQNLFHPESRGSARMPATGRSRYGDSRSTFEGGYRIRNVRVSAGKDGRGGETAVDPVVTDTRMQVRLPAAMKAKPTRWFQASGSFRYRTENTAKTDRVMTS